MQTIDGLKRKIQSTEDLLSVVKTMKALAAVSIRQYEKAVDSLADYNKTVELGLQVVLRDRPDFTVHARRVPDGPVGVFVFGADQGMAGSLNDQVVSHALAAMADRGTKPEDRRVMAVGERIAAILEDAGQPVESYATVPGSVDGITPSVQDLLLKIDSWNNEDGIVQLYLFYSSQASGAPIEPQTVRLLPLDQEWLSAVRTKPWPSRSLPGFTMDWDALFSSLVREYLFVSLFRAFAESLASENASRLASMQGAQQNVEHMLSALTTGYNQTRQMAITEELLDIVAGFEALEKSQ